MDCRPFPLPVWSPKRNDNAVGIEFRILLENRDLLIAELKFSVHGTFDAHTAPWDCHVLCLEGAGYVLVGDETQPLKAGESVRWPKDQLHQLWTDGQTMITQMIEHRHQVEDPARAWREHQAAKPAPR
jgi:quercetin dioxygenase-like cupin family protein